MGTAKEAQVVELRFSTEGDGLDMVDLKIMSRVAGEFRDWVDEAAAVLVAVDDREAQGW